MFLEGKEDSTGLRNTMPPVFAAGSAIHEVSNIGVDVSVYV